jgi:glyoxylate/hydroxypyruvate reductase A
MRDPTLPQSVPLTRMVDTLLAKGMVEFAVMAALMLFRDMPHYLAQQRNALWKPLPQRTASECTVGVMGLGELGSAVLDGLRSYGFRLRGWSRSQRSIAGIETFDSAGLHDFLATTNILISILPGTPHTRGLLNYDTMGRLPRGASIANLGRGSLIDIDGLIARLDEDHLAAAFLDVAPEEPVASHSPLWCHPKIVLTPHIAAATLPDHAAQNIIHDIRALADGRPLIHEVVRDRGY